MKFCKIIILLVAILVSGSDSSAQKPGVRNGQTPLYYGVQQKKHKKYHKRYYKKNHRSGSYQYSKQRE